MMENRIGEESKIVNASRNINCPEQKKVALNLWMNYKNMRISLGQPHGFPLISRFEKGHIIQIVFYDLSCL